MPVTGPEVLPDRQTPLLASGGESVRVSAISIGAYKFPTTDSRDDVGFLGSLPLSPRTKSKPVTPWMCNLVSLSHRAGPAHHGAPGGPGVVRAGLGGLVAERHRLPGGEGAAG